MHATKTAPAETHFVKMLAPSPSAPPPSMPAYIIPAAAAGLGILALILAYAQAILRGDQQPGITNLPDITHCVLKQPERGLFLTLFMPACMCMAGSWGLGAARSPTAWKLGLVACGLLIMGEAMLDEHPNWTLHTIGASGFFLFSMIAECFRAWQSGGEQPGSLTAKKVVAVFNVTVIVIDLVLALTKQPGWTQNLCEWIAAFSVVAYHAIFAVDLSAARITLVA